jgi:hypothetical protein
MKYLFAPLFALLLVLGVGITPATGSRAAQTKFKAGISGRLTDPNGAVIVGGNVSLTDRRTRKVIRVSTNENGEYAADLAVGSYDVEVDMPGFKKAKRKYIPVHPEARSFVDFMLEPEQQ